MSLRHVWLRYAGKVRVIYFVDRLARREMQLLSSGISCDGLEASFLL